MNIWIAELSNPHRYNCKVQPRDTIVNILDMRAIEDALRKIARSSWEHKVEYLDIRDIKPM